MNTPVCFEEQLRLSQQGDRDAYAEIVRSFQGTVSGVAYSLLGDFHQSEDVAQETFLVAWKKLAELSDSTKFPAWICSIARNLARNAARKKSNSFLKRALPIAENDTPAQGNREQIELQHRQSEFLWSTIEKIPEKYREPLVLYYRNNQSVRDIAAVLDISEEAAKKRLARARTYLKNEIERSFAGTLLANCPGEAFTIAVAAALPPLVLGAAANSVLAASEALGVGSKTGAATGAGAGAGTAAKATSSLGLLEGTGILAGSFFVSMVMLAPGLVYLWSVIRNAPTLRTRRYTLVVGSLAVWWSMLCVGLGTLFYSLAAFAQQNPLFAETMIGDAAEDAGSVLLWLTAVVSPLLICILGFALIRCLDEKRRIRWKTLYNEDSPGSAGFQPASRSEKNTTQTVPDRPLAGKMPADPDSLAGKMPAVPGGEWSFAALVRCMRKIIASLFLISAICTGIMYFMSTGMSPGPLVPCVVGAVLFSFSAIYAWFVRDSLTMMRTDADLQTQPPLLSSAYRTRKKTIVERNIYGLPTRTEPTPEQRTHYRLMGYNFTIAALLTFWIGLYFFCSLYGSCLSIFVTFMYMGVYPTIIMGNFVLWIDLFPHRRKEILFLLFLFAVLVSVAIFALGPFQPEAVMQYFIAFHFTMILLWSAHLPYMSIKGWRMRQLQKAAKERNEELVLPEPLSQPAIFLDPYFQRLTAAWDRFLQFVFTHGSDRFPSPRQTARMVVPSTCAVLAVYVLLVALIVWCY